MDYGACQGLQALSSNSVYQNVVATIENATETAIGTEILATGAATAVIYGASLLGAADFAGAVWVAASVAVPVLGIAVGVAVGLVEVANWLGVGSCNINVWKVGGTEQIECSWYPGPADNGNPGWIPNALNWLAQDAGPNGAHTSMTMTAEDFAQQHSVFIDQNDPLLAMASLIAPGIESLPTAYDMLRQVQLPAAAAVISAAPGLLMALTSPVMATIPGTALPMAVIPIQVQFPALKAADVTLLQTAKSLVGAYAGVISSAKAFAAASSNWPINANVFATSFGLTKSDALSILNSEAAGHFTNPTLPVSTTGPVTLIPGSKPTIASNLASGTALVVGSASIAFVLYKMWMGYTFAKSVQGLWSDVKTGASKVKGAIKRGAQNVERDAKKIAHRRGRKRNPLMLPGRSSATGGRVVAYRVLLEEEEVRFDGRSASLYRHGSEIARFSPSAFQKTKIRSGHGELLIFKDQLGG